MALAEEAGEIPDLLGVASFDCWMLPYYRQLPISRLPKMSKQLSYGSDSAKMRQMISGMKWRHLSIGESSLRPWKR